MARSPSVIPSISHTLLLIFGKEEQPNTIIGGVRALFDPPEARDRPEELIRIIGIDSGCYEIMVLSEC